MFRLDSSFDTVLFEELDGNQTQMVVDARAPDDGFEIVDDVNSKWLNERIYNENCDFFKEQGSH